MDKTALNLRIDSSIYKMLDEATRTKSQTKTHIIEQALLQYLPNVEDNQHRVDSIDKETLFAYMEGVSCPINSKPDLGQNETFCEIEDKTPADGLTHRGIAQIYGVKAETLGKWVNGKRKPSGENVRIFEEININYRFDTLTRKWFPI